MIGTLVAKSLAIGSVEWLERLPTEMLDSLTREAIEWILLYTKKYGTTPDSTRYKATAHGIIWDKSHVGSPIEDLFDQSLLMLKREHTLSMLRKWQLSIEGGEMISNDDVVDLSIQLSTSSSVASQVVSLGDWDWDDIDPASLKLKLNPASLDNITGSIRNGTINIIVARPGVGKTQLLCHFASDWYAAGKKVLFVSCELDLRTIISRIQAILAGCNPHVIVGDDTLSKGWAIAKAKARRAEYDELGGKLDFSESTAVKDVTAMIADGPYDVVLIDSFYLMQNAARSDGDWHRVKLIVDQLRQATLHKSVPIIMSSQLKRTGKPAGFNLEDIAFSDSIGMAADLVLTAYVEGRDALVIDVIKNRNGVSFGSATLRFNWETSTIEELSVWS